MAKKQIERLILAQLDRIDPRLMNVGTLWSEVRLDDETVDYDAFSKALKALEGKYQVQVIRGEDRNKAKITRTGSARLTE